MYRMESSCVETNDESVQPFQTADTLLFDGSDLDRGQEPRVLADLAVPALVRRGWSSAEAERLVARLTRTELSKLLRDAANPRVEPHVP
jgi:hypothetical protein